jgi:large subunit ribosomal protein L34
LRSNNNTILVLKSAYPVDKCIIHKKKICQKHNLIFSKTGSIILGIMSQTYKPKNRKRLKTHGFLSRMKTSNGARVILARLRKGRKLLAVTIGKKRISK